MSTPLHLILLAGGEGSRVGGVPKQFRNTDRGALFAVSLRTFLGPSTNSNERWHLSSATVVAPKEWQQQVREELDTFDLPTFVAVPGSTRTASTWQATSVLAAQGNPEAHDLVAVHDAARPFASRELLATLAVAALDHGVAVPGLPVTDTIVESVGEGTRYLQRDSLVAVQTPQVSTWHFFAESHRWAHEAGRDFTDDGGLLAERGHATVVVPGEPENWKVTTANDWDRAEDLLRE
ncbi:MAG: 2-C-methyl-D-erythritol 4-phosphate cytidylyltransferase [Candidatus Krumholzibacteriia bacterium]|jgi:2-C-methyl-D-erythritol 4-phosphate cytidylyltransferase/2-C-methyl-D-erythritol 2,4-cyclodiphosphate synthase